MIMMAHEKQRGMARITGLVALVLFPVMLAGCQTAAMHVVPTASEHHLALAADDIVLMMRQAGFTDSEILKYGTDVRNALAQGDLLKALQHCDNNPVPLSRILKAGFTNAEEGFEVVQDAVGVAADLEGESLLQRVTYLSVISNTTPMLGLIGTVQGMIFAFFNLGTAAAGVAQTNMLAVNISHGLWATAVGLGTAVPAGIYYFFFKMRCTRIILHQEALTLDLIKTLRNVEVVHD